MTAKGFGAWNLVFGLSLAFLTTAAYSRAAGFPDKPIRVIVYQAAGSGTDSEARGIVPHVQKHLGVPVTVENVPGAGGKIGVGRVMKAKPDGYTLLIHTTTQTLMGGILLYPEYHVADLTPIFSWSLTNQVLVVHNETWKTLDEFIREARVRPLSAGIPGRGTVSHLMSLILVEGLAIKVNWVPFDSGGDALTSLAGKHIDFASTGTTTALPLVRGGKLRPLLVFADRKDIVYPDVPLAKEMGYNFPAMPMIRGADGPPKMPAEVVKTLEEAFAKAVKEPEYIAWSQKRMMEIVPLHHEEYRKAIDGQRKQIEKYRDLLKGSR
jgi:tripartite-type tricarboxylate transporter receptor subunit TctC